MAPSRCEAHGKVHPCSQCTAALWALLDAREPGTRLWKVDVAGVQAVLSRGLPDLSVCRCGAGSTAFERSERCSCKGGKTTALRLAERRCDAGAAWSPTEHVTPAPGAPTLKGSDRSWQEGNPYGASKEALQVLNMIKAATQAG